MDLPLDMIGLENMLNKPSINCLCWSKPENAGILEVELVAFLYRVTAYSGPFRSLIPV